MLLLNHLWLKHLPSEKLLARAKCAQKEDSSGLELSNHKGFQFIGSFDFTYYN